MASFRVDKYGDTIERPHATEEPRGYPECYVNCDETLMIDPPTKNAQMWIRDPDDVHLREMSNRRGALKNHAGVMRALEVVKQPDTPVRNFVPHSEHLDALDKFTGKCVGNSTLGDRLHWKWQDKVGGLPIIHKLIWENQLSDVPSYVIEKQMWSQRYANNRAFAQEESPR